MAYSEHMTANTKIKFLSGLEANIVNLLPDAPVATRVDAEEGAFYLTTDSHRLFVGQKDSTTNNIYAEEISRGVAIVEDIHDLPQGTHAVQDGDFFYIKKRNILCVYEGPEIDELGNTVSAGNWQQINASSTGIDSVDQSVSEISETVGALTEASNPLLITTSLNPDANTGEDPITGKIVFQAGDNVTLSTAQVVLNPNNQALRETVEVINISSENSQSELTVEQTSQNQDTSLILSDGVNDDTFVNFEGGNEDISVSSYKYKQVTSTTAEADSSQTQIYTYNGVSYEPTSGPFTSGENYYEKVPTIVIHSNQVSGGYVLPRYDSNDSTVTGFLLGADITDGTYHTPRYPVDLTSQANTGKGYSNASPYESSQGQGNILDPIIAYGSDGSGTTASSKFRDNTATLNVYTTTEVDNRIESAIASSLQAADAMTYKGVFTNDINSDLYFNHELSQGLGYIHIGDTYKANHTHDETSTATIQKTWDNTSHNLFFKTGDLIIFSAINGYEDGEDSNTGEKYITWNNLKFEVIPSGDEPWVESEVSGNNITLYNANITDSNVDNGILKLSFVDGTYTEASVSANTQDTSINEITFNHAAASFTNNTQQTLTFNKSNVHNETPQDTDSIQQSTKGIRFFGLDSTLNAQGRIAGLSVDGWGHVTGIRGQEITLYHNYTNTLDFGLDDTPTTENYVDYNRAIINITPYDYLGVYSGSNMGTLTLKSSSLAISTTEGTQVNGIKNTGTISIEMEWGTF